MKPSILCIRNAGRYFFNQFVPSVLLEYNIWDTLATNLNNWGMK